MPLKPLKPLKPLILLKIPLSNMNDNFAPAAKHYLVKDTAPRVTRSYAWHVVMPILYIVAHSLATRSCHIKNNPEETYEQQRHEEDFFSLWFAVTKGDKGNFHLKQFPRFSDLVEAHQKSFQQRVPCYAQLVSFIGGTGAGKSTIIRVLMKQPWDVQRLSAAEDLSDPLPFIGRVGSTSTTTGDVHLYAAPDVDVARPSMVSLYADCEGLNGGSQPPLTTKATRYVLRKIKVVIDTKITDSAEWATRTWRFLRRANLFPLDLDGSRENAVEKLFPRLLYNFSDVVVYVMPYSISRSMEQVIIKLLETAENSRKTAVNRVILPHLIVVLNMSPSNVADWESSETTAAILEEQSSTLESNEVIRNYRRSLDQLRDTPIVTVRDLLTGCYSSVQFIRLPGAGNQHLFSRQVQKLDGLIRQATEEARRTKAQAHLLLNTDTQDRMFKMAFEHYKSSLETPFDFLEAFLATKPLDTSLSSTIFALLKATMVAYQSITPQLSGAGFCHLITPVICSTIALDSCRSHGRQLGRLQDIYRGGTLTSPKENTEGPTYKSQLGDAIAQFFDLACPCDFVSENNTVTRRCVNYRRAHTTFIHQDNTGQVFGIGTFESTFVDECLQRWNDVIDDCLRELDGIERSPDDTDDPNDLTIIWSFHERNLRHLYNQVSQLDVRRIEACSWCFRDDVIGPLRCEHWVCWECAQMIGALTPEVTHRGQRMIDITRCDLHSPPIHFEITNCVIEKEPDFKRHTLPPCPESAMQPASENGQFEVTVLGAAVLRVCRAHFSIVRNSNVIFKVIIETDLKANSLRSY
ncbi:hypothetical protein DER44DRAFT_889906 [Fusarium oxysporum]|nr:hypothetical protein DER44DRAFT_889906 [Fusarium oxysporum]